MVMSHRRGQVHNILKRDGGLQNDVSSLVPSFLTMHPFSTILSFFFIATGFSQKILLSDDDGWATAQIRAQYNSLKSAGFDVSSREAIWH